MIYHKSEKCYNFRFITFLQTTQMQIYISYKSFGYSLNRRTIHHNVSLSYFRTHTVSPFLEYNVFFFNTAYMLNYVLTWSRTTKSSFALIRCKSTAIICSAITNLIRTHYGFVSGTCFSSLVMFCFATGPSSRIRFDITVCSIHALHYIVLTGGRRRTCFKISKDSLVFVFFNELMVLVTTNQL